MRRRIMKWLLVAVLVGAALRLSGLVHVPGRWLLAGVALELVLAMLEGAVVAVALRRAYRRRREAEEPFEALVAALYDVEPRPLAFAVEQELRLWRRAWRLVASRPGGRPCWRPPSRGWISARTGRRRRTSSR